MIIERRGDQDSCGNTLFATLPSRKCPREVDARQGAYGMIGNVKAKPPVQETLVPDAAMETRQLPPATGQEPPRSPLIMSCDKVAAIVGDYGFNGIRASDCEGQVYSFDASRDGKPFMITLNSVSGELIKVRKAIP